MNHHVRCFCPNRHLVADLQVNDSVERQYAIQVMRFAVHDLITKSEPWHGCDKCGAPNEDWFCEVGEPEGEITVMGGVSTGA